MPEDAGPGPAPATALPSDPDDLAALLPFHLIRSQILPPAPNRRKSAADWLPEFGGAAWVAYGASSLLVISHFPNPLYEHETLVGSFLQQVIEPPPAPDAGDEPGDVNAVRWCPARPSEGEIAAAAGNCVWFYSPDAAEDDPSSFRWRQTAGIVQSFAVEAIEWTGSGDGLVAAGISVVLWVRKNMTWEMAWKSSSDIPQTMVSTTLFTEGPLATVACSSNCMSDTAVFSKKSSPLLSKECSFVSVYHRDGKSGFTKFQLLHPQPVSMIQWRPSTVAQLEKDASCSWRNVLLTCCLDGTVRLWSEIENSRIKKASKDAHGKKSYKRAYHVIAVIEINQHLRGTIDMDMFISWATECGDIVCEVEGGNYCLAPEVYEHDHIGKCEWVISVGPRSSLTLWAIHCLDDTSPLRFPRVTLWKTLDLMEFKECKNFNSDLLHLKDQPVFVKAVASRSHPYAPPNHCSLLQLLADNSFSWLQFYSPMSNSKTDGSSCQTSMEKCLPCFAGGVLNQDGHTGKIIQLDVYPCNSEVELAASLDSNGSLFFWSLSTVSSYTLGSQAVIHPAWKLLGKVILQEKSSVTKYSTVRWAPVVLGENRFLLLGHADGIDCFVIQVAEKGETIFCYKILSIHFDGLGHEGPPDHIFATALASTYGCSIFSNGFLLFGIWMGKFHALSWKVILHLEDPSGSICKCDFDPQMVSVLKRNAIYYAGKRLYATADMCSSFLPDPHNHDQVTSVAVLPPDDQALSVQHYATSSGSEMNSCMYTMVTGCSDGTLKLWRMCYAGNAADSKGEFLPWEIVGMFNAHQGPVSAVSLSTCGGKIATIGMDGQSNSASLHIWEPVRLIGGGSFLLEDVISLSGAVVALNWMTIGDGRLLLGVCMPNTLCIYSEKRFTKKDLKSKKSKEMNIWFCITQSHVHYVCQDFCWGPKLSPVLVHEKHISLFSQWSSIAENMLHEACSPAFVHGTSNNLPCALYTERDMCNAKESSLDESKHKNNHNGQNLKFVRKPYDFGASGLHSILDISDRLHGCLEVYHPQALMHYLYSGNWKHVLAILRHLVESIKSDDVFASIPENSKSEHPSRKILDIQFLAYFQETVSSSLSNKKLQWGQDISPTMLSFESPRNSLQFGGIDLLTNAPKSISTPISEKSEITWLINTLEKTHTIPGITDNEKTQLLSIVDILGEVSGTSGGSVYQSLDEPGRRFWVGVRYRHLYFLRKYGKSAAAEELVVDSAVASWAFLSDCKENLFDSIFSAEPSWLEMRNMGVGYWFINTTQLRTKMEKLARSQYLKRKDPKDCALLYLALNRVQVLAGLFKISRDEKDKLLVAFLSRNFQEEKNKAAALKNAFVLMGRHQLELAIAFFLLGGDPSSAVTVCAKNLGDEQLALVICRLIEGFGGPLEHQLISNFLLPSAMEKGDYWLSSMLEWTLGNYSRSLNILIDSQMGSITNKPTTFANRAVFSDPTIGRYCAILAAKNSLKNAFGDYMAIMLSKLAMLMTAIALKRCGLPFEALESLISSFDIEGKDQINLPDTRSHDIFHGILNLFSSSGACNWMLRDVACHLELNAKLNIALQYLTKLLCDHLNCPCDLAPPDKLTIHGCDTHKEELRIRKFKDRLNVVMLTFEQKYSLDPADLGNKILILSCNKGFLYFGYLLLDSHLCRGEKTDCHSPDGFTLNPTLHRMLAKSSKEISYLLARYVVFCGLTDSILKLNYSSNFGFRKNSRGQFYPVNFYLQNFLYLLSTFRPVFKLYNGGILNEDLTSRTFAVVDFLEYCVHVAFAWIKKDVKGLILMVRLILDVSANDQSSFGVSASELMKVLHQTSGLMVHDMSSGDICNSPDSNCEGRKLKQFDSRMASMSEDEMWQLIGVYLWLYIFTFAKRHLTSSTGTEMHDGESDMLNLFPFFNGKMVMTLLEYIFSSLSKQLTALLRQKALKGLPVSSLPWLYESGHSQPRSAHHNSSPTVNSLQPTENEDIESLLDLLCEVSLNAEDLVTYLLNDRLNRFPCCRQRLSTSWQDCYKGILVEHGVSDNHKMETEVSNNILKNESIVLAQKSVSKTNDYLEAKGKDSTFQADTIFFHSPKEVFRRNGELIESICFNSIDEQEVALASNRKGLLFFNWKVEKPFQEQADYVWSESDWPKSGWAGCESTPIPTFVSTGVGLGGKKGVHLGLGGATTGYGPLARPGRDLTGGGAFGIPGYAGIGASGLGWGEQEDFTDYVDPPATVENIRSCALSSHPSKSFLLVGSSNTHVYLWEFGKDRALATYGVLPAANVPPPYALASISALKFDNCGHRFVTSALDGTVCTWQLEVGGRNNVHPTESSLCFNNHALDVAFLGASGSILAAAGCSSNGHNVVVWDTLAPPSTSQVSLVCHEGGARSLSVFDSGIGSGSVSPLIVTGGKGGDVGLHDFRYIATGKSKRHRQSSDQDLKPSSNTEAFKNGENANGMIWYIPKAHSGSITTISTIPHTSLFLTGSKDGDVKLWDAKKSQLVFHWPKLHDKHTFLQPNSRGFAGVVRAAVTDIQVLSNGFLSCGGDGSVKLVQLR